jgi:hypothetical protein
MIVLAVLLLGCGEEEAKPKPKESEEAGQDVDGEGEQEADTAASTEVEEPDTAGPTEDLCMGVLFEGCCASANILYSCSGGTLFAMECSTFGGTCGWNAESEYFTCSDQDDVPADVVVECPEGLPSPEELSR